MELNHFLKFLDIQLSSCERSIFCNEDLVGDVMSGLKTFVVKFMIRMSKVGVYMQSRADFCAQCTLTCKLLHYSYNNFFY